MEQATFRLYKRSSGTNLPAVDNPVPEAKIDLNEHEPESPFKVCRWEPDYRRNNHISNVWSHPQLIVTVMTSASLVACSEEVNRSSSSPMCGGLSSAQTSKACMAPNYPNEPARGMEKICEHRPAGELKGREGIIGYRSDQQEATSHKGHRY